MHFKCTVDSLVTPLVIQNCAVAGPSLTLAHFFSTSFNFVWVFLWLAAVAIFSCCQC